MRYGSDAHPVTAVDHLNLEVQLGTVTSILGPNGAGKTTTLETCEGFRKPQAGTVRVLGLDPVTDARELRPRIGVMLQSGGAWVGVRAHEMLRHMASLYANPLDADGLIERLGLESCGRTTFRRLSGGQQQRVSLAMALIGRPELVFLDEPTAGLDPQSRRATWELISELRTDGLTVVLTTHFMDEAETLSDFVHIVDAGTVIASGAPEELKSSDSHNMIRFTAPPGLDTAGLSAALPHDAKIDESQPGHYVVVGPVDPHQLAALTAWCASRGVLASSILVQRETLEDRFLALTGKELR
jgi:ABC-2 type transport system ATP-binding protein